MSPSDAANVFAIVLLIGVGGLVAMATTSTNRSIIADAAVPLSAIFAVGATIASLYFSERAGFVPCEFCWYQRIAMYPLAVILSLAALRRDLAIRPYAMTIAGSGLLLALYHMQLQWFPDQSSTCDPTNPCSGRWVEALGFMTIPQMAGLSFAAILGLLAMARQPVQKSAGTAA